MIQSTQNRFQLISSNYRATVPAVSELQFQSSLVPYVSKRSTHSSNGETVKYNPERMVLKINSEGLSNASDKHYNMYLSSQRSKVNTCTYLLGRHAGWRCTAAKVEPDVTLFFQTTLQFFDGALCVGITAVPMQLSHWNKWRALKLLLVCLVYQINFKI